MSFFEHEENAENSQPVYAYKDKYILPAFLLTKYILGFLELKTVCMIKC